MPCCMSQWSLVQAHFRCAPTLIDPRSGFGLNEALGCSCPIEPRLPLLPMQTGIRLITTLTNFWAEFGGMGWYVDSILGAGNAPELFYSDPRVIAAFQTWVRVRDAL